MEEEEKRSKEDEQSKKEELAEGELPEVTGPDNFEDDETGKEKVAGASNKNNIVFIAVAVILVIALLASGVSGVFGDLFSEAPIDDYIDDYDDSGFMDNGLPDDGLDPQKALVTVNGEEITAGEVAMLMQQEKERYMAQGMDIDSPEMSDIRQEIEAMAVDRLIGMKLLEQKALEEGFSATEEEIDERFMEYAEMFGGEEQFLMQIQAMDMDRDDLEKEISRELAIDLYLSGYIEGLEDSGKLDFTEEEVKGLYEEHKEEIEEDFDDIKDELAMMVRNEKEYEFVNDLIEDLREESDIVYLM